MDRILITSLDEMECAVFFKLFVRIVIDGYPESFKDSNPLQDELAGPEHLSTIRYKWKD